MACLQEPAHAAGRMLFPKEMQQELCRSGSIPLSCCLSASFLLCPELAPRIFSSFSLQPLTGSLVQAKCLSDRHPNPNTPGSASMNFPFCRPLVTLILLAVVSAAAGCSQTAESASEEQLHERKRKEFDEHIHPRHDLMAIACLYLDCEEKQHHPPSAASDLHGCGAMDARALQRLRQGRYAFRWGMDLRALPPSEREQLVLGYETTPSARDALGGDGRCAGPRSIRTGI